MLSLRTVDLTCRIRSAEVADLPKLCLIEDLSFRVPWSLRDFRRELRHNGPMIRVAELEGLPVGFAIWRVRLSNPPSQSLASMAVHPSFRGYGIGKALLMEPLQAWQSLGRWVELRAIVCETDGYVLEWFRRRGWRAVRVLRGHCGQRDGYLFARRYKVA